MALRAATYRGCAGTGSSSTSLMLFEIHDQRRLRGACLRCARDEPEFLHGDSLYHPDTWSDPSITTGSGAEPGLKDPTGNWDLTTPSRADRRRSTTEQLADRGTPYLRATTSRRCRRRWSTPSTEPALSARRSSRASSASRDLRPAVLPWLGRDDGPKEGLLRRVGDA